MYYVYGVPRPSLLIESPGRPYHYNSNGDINCYCFSFYLYYFKKNHKS